MTFKATLINLEWSTFQYHSTDVTQLTQKVTHSAIGVAPLNFRNADFATTLLSGI